MERFLDAVKRKSRIALAIAGRRFTSVMALTLKSGLELEKGLELAPELVENNRIENRSWRAPRIWRTEQTTIRR